MGQQESHTKNRTCISKRRRSSLPDPSVKGPWRAPIQSFAFVCLSTRQTGIQTRTQRHTQNCPCQQSKPAPTLATKLATQLRCHVVLSKKGLYVMTSYSVFTVQSQHLPVECTLQSLNCICVTLAIPHKNWFDNFELFCLGDYFYD